jgi:hypothetical protein
VALVLLCGFSIFMNMREAKLAKEKAETDQQSKIEKQQDMLMGGESD